MSAEFMTALDSTLVFHRRAELMVTQNSLTIVLCAVKVCFQDEV